MKIVIKQSDIKRQNPMKEAVMNPLFRKRVVTSKKVYNRKRIREDV